MTRNSSATNNSATVRLEMQAAMLKYKEEVIAWIAVFGAIQILTTVTMIAWFSK